MSDLQLTGTFFFFRATTRFAATGGMSEIKSQSAKCKTVESPLAMLFKLTSSAVALRAFGGNDSGWGGNDGVGGMAAVWGGSVSCVF